MSPDQRVVDLLEPPYSFAMAVALTQIEPEIMRARFLTAQANKWVDVLLFIKR